VTLDGASIDVVYYSVEAKIAVVNIQRNIQLQHKAREAEKKLQDSILDPILYLSK